MRVRRGGPQATSWLPVQPVAGGPVFPAVCSKLPHEGACWNRPARLHCSQPESKPIWAEKSNLFSFSCQKDMRCLVNFSSSSIFFSVSFSFFSSKLFQVCRGRVVFCGGKVPCWRVWCKPGEFGASWKVGGGGLVGWCKPGSDRARSPGRDASSWCKPPSVYLAASPSSL